MWRPTIVVISQSLFEVNGQAHISFAREGDAFDKIDVEHWVQPSFAKASEGILLRALRCYNPAKRVGAKQDGQGSWIRTNGLLRPRQALSPG
jgi:hypothetical protein